MKKMTNNLICVLYSTGFLRVICLESDSLIVELDLKGKHSQFERINEAKIASLTHLSKPNSYNTGIEKAIDISLAFSNDIEGESGSSLWKLLDLQLKFRNVNIPNNHQRDY